MAKPKSKQKTVVKRGKKKWFKVVTPEYLRSIELGEITAYEPAELPGRTVCVPLKEVSGSMRDGSSKIKLRITKVQGETCQTEPIALYVQDSQVQRSDRRAKERIICIVDATTKDKQKIRVKAYVLLNKSVIRAVRTAIFHTTTNFIQDYIKHREAKDVFAVTTQKNIANQLKDDLKKIYPAQVIIWKITKI
jgi:ribosomal protein S3AE